MAISYQIIILHFPKQNRTELTGYKQVQFNKQIWYIQKRTCNTIPSDHFVTMGSSYEQRQRYSYSLSIHDTAYQGVHCHLIFFLYPNLLNVQRVQRSLRKHLETVKIPIKACLFRLIRNHHLDSLEVARPA